MKKVPKRKILTQLSFLNPDDLKRFLKCPCYQKVQKLLNDAYRDDALKIIDYYYSKMCRYGITKKEHLIFHISYFVRLIYLLRLLKVDEKKFFDEFLEMHLRAHRIPRLFEIFNTSLISKYYVKFINEQSKKMSGNEQYINEQDVYVIRTLTERRKETIEQVLRLPIIGLFVSERVRLDGNI